MHKITQNLLLEKGWKERLHRNKGVVYVKNGIFLEYNDTEHFWMVKDMIDESTIFHTNYYYPVKIYMENYREEGDQSKGFNGKKMTLEELQLLKNDLQKKLHKHIQDFEESTGLRVEDIDLSRVGMVGSNFKQIHGVATKINFNDD